MRRTVAPRVLFLIPAGVSLLAGLDAGLFRLGWALPLPQLDLPLAHGPLMVSAFLGTLIGLEKAVAVQRKWAYLGPFSTGIGGVTSELTAIAGALLACFGDRFHPPAYDWGLRLLGVGTLSVGSWLLSNDIAWIAIRRPGLSRFMASSLLLGYVWLAGSGALSLVNGGLVSGELYDAAIHAFFLGFVFSMVFAHGPVIFPAILGRPLLFHRGFYLPLLVLHAGLAARVLGDLTGLTPWRRWGGLLNAASILLFVGTVVLGVARGVSEGSRE